MRSVGHVARVGRGNVYKGFCGVTWGKGTDWKTQA